MKTVQFVAPKNANQTSENLGTISEFIAANGVTDTDMPAMRGTQTRQGFTFINAANERIYARLSEGLTAEYLAGQIGRGELFSCELHQREVEAKDKDTQEVIKDADGKPVMNIIYTVQRPAGALTDRQAVADTKVVEYKKPVRRAVSSNPADAIALLKQAMGQVA